MPRKKTHDNEGLLAEFRLRPRCEFCSRGTASGADPHHLWPRGMGSGSRMDVRFNLIALCRVCHNKVHTGQITRTQLLDIVCHREGLTPDQIIVAIGKIKYGR